MKYQMMSILGRAIADGALVHVAPTRLLAAMSASGAYSYFISDRMAG
jgi:hypothetical protein